MRFILVIMTIFCFVMSTTKAENIPRLSSIYNFWDNPVDTELNGDYAFITSVPGHLNIFDISNPEDPELIGSLSLGFYRDSFSINRLHNSVIWLLGNNRILAVDISDPNTPTIIRSFTAGEDNFTAAISDELAIIRGRTVIQIAPEIWDETKYCNIYDIADLDDPILLNRNPDALSGYSYVLHERTLFYYEDGLCIMDLSNPRNPDVIVETDMDAKPIKISDDGEILFAMYNNSSQIKLVDVSDPESPDIISVLDYGQITDFHVNGDMLSITYGNDQLVMLDVSDPRSPDVVMETNTTDQGVKLSVDENIMAVIDEEGQIELIEISDPDEPEQVSDLDYRGQITAVSIEDDYAFIAGGQRGFMVVDISDIGSPREVGRIRRVINGNQIAIENGYAYVCSDDRGIHIIDITDPEEPRYCGRIYHQGSNRQIISDGEWLYFQSDQNIYIYNISNPEEPEQVSVIEGISIFQVIRNSLYGCDANSFFKYDISNRNHPRQVMEERLFQGSPYGSKINSFVIDGNLMQLIYHSVFLDHTGRVYLGSMLYVMDISNPDTVRKLDDYCFDDDDLRGFILGYNNRQVFISSPNIIEVHSTWNPEQLQRRHSTFDNVILPRDMHFKDDYAIVADNTTLSIYACSEILHSPEVDTDLLPYSFGILSAFPNPFNSTTTINYSIPTGTSISLDVFNLLGQRVQTLVEGQQQAGNHRAILRVNGLPSGLYFIRLEASDQAFTQKVMLIR